MLSMEENMHIIIDYFRNGKSQREISRDLGIHRKTVKKYIERYQSGVQACRADRPGKPGTDFEGPRYDSSLRQKRKLTEEVVGLIQGYLAENAVKCSQGKSKQQMKQIDIHEALVEAGYEISYRSVSGYIRDYLKRSAEVFIRQQYQPGEAVEFDWGEVKVDLDGKTKNMMLAVFTACYSNHRWAMLFYRQDMISFLQAHVSYFAAVGGVSKEMVYDNMRVAVRRFVLKNADKQPTEDLLKLSAYYQFNYRFCNRGKGNEKGHVERSVEFVRRKAFARVDSFETLEAANAHLWQICDRLNGRTVRGKEESIAEAFAAETACMRPAPPAYQACNLRKLKVNKYSCIRLDNNYYSVLEGHVGRWVKVKVYVHRLEVFDNKNQLLASHDRRHSRDQWYIQLDHYLKTLAKKPGALVRSEAWYQADPRLHRLFEAHFTQRPKLFIELLLWARKSKISIDRVIQACQKARKSSLNSPISLEKIQLLATNQMKPHLHPDTQTKPPKDAIGQFAAEQLAQAQALFS